MALPLLRPSATPAPQEPLLGHLRLAALRCRTAPRGPVEACALLHPEAQAEDYATALARLLPEVLIRRPVFWRTGTESLSFDESWLLALARALRTGDADSAAFLLARRVLPRGRPLLRLLVTGLSERLDAS